MMDVKELFADRVLSARTRKYMTQKTLAEKCGVSRVTITNIESARNEPSLNTLRKLCEVLDVSADWLIGRID